VHNAGLDLRLGIYCFDCLGEAAPAIDDGDQDFVQPRFFSTLERQRRLFRWWKADFSKAVLDRVTTYVSKTFADAFAEAKLDDFRFHDLRHKTTCRLFLRTTFSDTDIDCIAGHKDMRMLRRYARFRGGRARRAHVVAEEPTSGFGA